MKLTGFMSMSSDPGEIEKADQMMSILVAGKLPEFSTGQFRGRESIPTTRFHPALRDDRITKNNVWFPSGSVPAEAELSQVWAFLLILLWFSGTIVDPVVGKIGRLETESDHTSLITRLSANYDAFVLHQFGGITTPPEDDIRN